MAYFTRPVNETRRDNAARGAKVELRQQVLVLYLGNPQLDSAVVAWSFYDGTAQHRREAAGLGFDPPYASGLEALEDGWRLLQYPKLSAPEAGREYDVGYLESEFVFEKMVRVSALGAPLEGE